MTAIFCNFLMNAFCFLPIRRQYDHKWLFKTSSAMMLSLVARSLAISPQFPLEALCKVHCHKLLTTKAKDMLVSFQCLSETHQQHHDLKHKHIRKCSFLSHENNMTKQQSNKPIPVRFKKQLIVLQSCILIRKYSDSSFVNIQSTNLEELTSNSETVLKLVQEMNWRLEYPQSLLETGLHEETSNQMETNAWKERLHV